MKKTLSRMMAAVLVVLAVVSMMSIGASAAHVTCKECIKAGLECKSLTATTEFCKISETQCARLYECNNGHKVFTYHRDGSFKDACDHIAITKATCVKAAVCGNCKSEFGAPGGHQFDMGVVRKPTCFKEGATVYTCKICGLKVEMDKVKPLSHWYAEWEPAGAGLNSAPCKRENCDYIKTTACADWIFQLKTEDKAESYTVCPVCGALSDGGRLLMVEDAKATPVTAWTPEGDLLFRQGELANGEKIIAVSFEFDARLAQYMGICKFTVPAEVMDGYKVMQLAADGAETELEVETDAQTASVTLNFASGDPAHPWTPVQMMHLVPVANDEAPAAEAK